MDVSLFFAGTAGSVPTARRGLPALLLRAGMPLLSQLLYVADQIAPDRKFEGVAEVRRVAGQDLPGAVLLVARNKIEHSLARGLLLEPSTVDLYNSMMLGAGVGTH